MTKLQQCDAGVHACQYFVKPMKSGKNAYWKRMCAPKASYTLVQCLGLTRRNFSDMGKSVSTTYYIIIFFLEIVECNYLIVVELVCCNH